MTGSIAVATDLAARVAEGGTVERADGFRVVRTPANPAFRWGNHLLAERAADLVDPGVWALRHRAAFPDLDFTTVGVDDPEPAFEESAWRAAGFEVERRSVLCAGAADIGRAWLGMRMDGRIVSALGVLPAAGGTARYQNVGTLTAYRRRGAAGRLVRAAAALAANRWGCTRLVLVADPDGPAIALYRRLGFRDVETQLQLTRMGAS